MLLWIHLHKDYTSHIRVSIGVMVIKEYTVQPSKRVKPFFPKIIACLAYKIKTITD